MNYNSVHEDIFIDSGQREDNSCGLAWWESWAVRRRHNRRQQEGN